MARNPVSISKRPTLKKGELRYYVRFWNENTGKYSNARSVLSIVQELGLNEKEYPPTSRTGALLIGQELLKRGGALSKKMTLSLLTIALQCGTGIRRPTFKAVSPGGSA
ncbi:MAG: hypothetical protein ABFC92_08620 [Rectinema sp.]